MTHQFGLARHHCSSTETEYTKHLKPWNRICNNISSPETEYTTTAEALKVVTNTECTETEYTITFQGTINLKNMFFSIQKETKIFKFLYIVF